MGPLSFRIANLFVDALWRIRPGVTHDAATAKTSLLRDDRTSVDSESTSLRGLIRRFPYWMKGRALLAKRALAHDDVATAYAESQALLALAPSHSRYHATALLQLGRCFLRRGDPSSALGFLVQAHTIKPSDTAIQEERSAALVLLGDRAGALRILKTIGASDLSAEGKAALQWLSREDSSSDSR